MSQDETPSAPSDGANAAAGSGTGPAATTTDTGAGPGGNVGGGLFRKTARDRLEAAEKLDTLLAITSPRLWMVLGTCLALVAAIGVWVFLGSATSTVPATGILLPNQGVTVISSPSPGTVTALPYDFGVQVAAQESVATVVDSSGNSVDVDSQVAGTIVAQYVTPGTFVQAGQPIVELFPLDSPIAGIMFVSATSGKSIQNGMPVNVSPSTAPSAQFGSIVGTVQSVSPLPLSTSKIEQLVGERAGLVQSIQALGSSLEVVVTLDRDPSTLSGYKWTSGSGAPFAITPGTLLTGQVILYTQHPSSVAF